MFLLSYSPTICEDQHNDQPASQIGSANCSRRREPSERLQRGKTSVGQSGTVVKVYVSYLPVTMA